jgi:hypothetical protein
MHLLFRSSYREVVGRPDDAGEQIDAVVDQP